MKLTFLQLIHKIDLEEMRSREDKYLLGYIATAMKNRCFDLRNKYYREKSCEQALDDMVSLPQDNDILFEEMIELEQFCSFLTKLQKTDSGCGICLRVFRRRAFQETAYDKAGCQSDEKSGD